jgi:hypothetical protein
LLSNLGYSRYCDRRDMAIDYAARHRFWEFDWQDQNDWKELAKQYIIDVVFRLYQGMSKILKWLMWIRSHKCQKVQQQYYWINVKTITHK